VTQTDEGPLDTVRVWRDPLTALGYRIGNLRDAIGLFTEWLAEPCAAVARWEAEILMIATVATYAAARLRECVTRAEIECGDLQTAERALFDLLIKGALWFAERSRLDETEHLLRLVNELRLR
jgi:hypothetical protein